MSGPVQTQLVGDVRPGRRPDPDGRHQLPGRLRRPEALPDALSIRSTSRSEWATPKLATAWARALRSETETDQDKLQLHAGYYVAALAADKAWAWTPDKSAIARAQGRLVDGAARRAPLRVAGRKPPKGAPPVRPENIFIGGAAPYWNARNNVAVPGHVHGARLAEGQARCSSRRIHAPRPRAAGCWVAALIQTEADARKLGPASACRSCTSSATAGPGPSSSPRSSVVAPTEMNSAIEELRALRIRTALTCACSRSSPRTCACR